LFVLLAEPVDPALSRGAHSLLSVIRMEERSLSQIDFLRTQRRFGAQRSRARPPGCTFSGPPMRLLSLRPDDSLTTQRMALSIDFPDSVSFLLTIQATGLLTFSLAGLTPAEYTSFRWTYPGERPCQYTFCCPFGCSFPSVVSRRLKPTLKGAPFFIMR
jgi:hypothetical protein